MPQAVYMKSMFRHFMDVWMHHRSYGAQLVDENLDVCLCALMFNVQGMLHEITREKLYGPRTTMDRS
jgi:hypothetical protein